MPSRSIGEIFARGLVAGGPVETGLAKHVAELAATADDHVAGLTRDPVLASERRDGFRAEREKNGAEASGDEERTHHWTTMV